MTIRTSSWRVDLSALLKDFAKPQKKAVLAGLNLAILGSIDMQQMTADEAIAGFYHATNCLYVKRSIKDRSADELMSRGVQLADLFEALPPGKARSELKKELRAMRSLCFKLLKIAERQAA